MSVNKTSFFESLRKKTMDELKDMEKFFEPLAAANKNLQRSGYRRQYKAIQAEIEARRRQINASVNDN